MNTPKLHLGLVAFALFAVSAFAQTRPAPGGTAVTSGETRVVVPTAVSELAAGYAEAIRQMALKSTVIYVKGDGKIVAVKGLRSARAVGSVLLLTLSAGGMVAVNPEHIVMISDSSVTPLPGPPTQS